MDLIKIPHFNPQELKILEREIKAMNVFDNERASKNSRENFHWVYGVYTKTFLDTFVLSFKIWYYKFQCVD